MPRNKQNINSIHPRNSLRCWAKTLLMTHMDTYARQNTSSDKCKIKKRVGAIEFN